jgi:uncharacterized protein (TIGR02246 family)
VFFGVIEEPTMSDNEAAIRALVQTWMDASRRGDTAAVLDLMTEDAVFEVPGREPFGREAFAAQSQGLADFEIDGRSEIVELQVNGDWAFSRNHIDLTVTPKSGPPVHRAGYTLTLYRKEADGRWRLMRDANLLTVVV